MHGFILYKSFLLIPILLVSHMQLIQSTHFAKKTSRATKVINKHGINTQKHKFWITAIFSFQNKNALSALMYRFCSHLALTLEDKRV